MKTPSIYIKHRGSLCAGRPFRRASGHDGALGQVFEWKIRISL